jgi:DNA-binding CsgD family transcriptional regulator
VLELLADGVPAREIAVRLGLAEATVRNHIRIVLRKLACHSQLQAVAVALRLDLIPRQGRESPSAGEAERTTDPA